MAHWWAQQVEVLSGKRHVMVALISEVVMCLIFNTCFKDSLPSRHVHLHKKWMLWLHCGITYSTNFRGFRLTRHKCYRLLKWIIQWKRRDTVLVESFEATPWVIARSCCWLLVTQPVLWSLIIITPSLWHFKPWDFYGIPLGGRTMRPVVCTFASELLTKTAHNNTITIICSHVFKRQVVGRMA